MDVQTAGHLAVVFLVTPYVLARLASNVWDSFLLLWTVLFLINTFKGHELSSEAIVPILSSIAIYELCSRFNYDSRLVGDCELVGHFVAISALVRTLYSKACHSSQKHHVKHTAAKASLLMGSAAILFVTPYGQQTFVIPLASVLLVSLALDFVRPVEADLITMYLSIAINIFLSCFWYYPGEMNTAISSYIAGNLSVQAVAMSTATLLGLLLSMLVAKVFCTAVRIDNAKTSTRTIIQTLSLLQGLGIVFFPVSRALVNKDFISFILSLVLTAPFLILALTTYWVLIILVSSYFAAWALEHGRWSRIWARKVFHFAVVFMFVPPFLYPALSGLHQFHDPHQREALMAFVHLSLGGAICLFVLVEYLRLSLCPKLLLPLSAYFAQFVVPSDLCTTQSSLSTVGTSYTNHADVTADSVLITHLSLLTAVTSSLFLVTVTQQSVDARSQALLSCTGLVTVGLSDAAAAMVGSTWGKRRWMMRGSLSFGFREITGKNLSGEGRPPVDLDDNSKSKNDHALDSKRSRKTYLGTLAGWTTMVSTYAMLFLFTPLPDPNALRFVDIFKAGAHLCVVAGITMLAEVGFEGNDNLALPWVCVVAHLQSLRYAQWCEYLLSAAVSQWFLVSQSRNSNVSSNS